MGKLKKDQTPRHYRVEWENDPEFKGGWLCKASDHSDKPDHAYCRWCRVSLRPHRNDLKAHLDRQCHQRVAKSMISRAQKTISDFSKIGDEKKILDIKLVLHAVVHGTINSMDHLSEMLKDLGRGTKFAHLKIHRTKTSKIIVNVIAPVFLKQLIDDIGGQYYSIILDESTDVSSSKYMAYCVRYFSVKHSKMVTNFLGFSEVTGTTAEELYKVFKEFLAGKNLKIEKLIGIGTDGASNLCGINHSLYTLLRKDVPTLQLIKCTCHSIDKCAEKSSAKLPSNLVFMIRETSNWFAHSALRQSMFEDLFAHHNNGAKPLKFMSLSTTRWLAIYSAISVILKQWEELKMFFNRVADSRTNKCYTAKTLASMYNDETNILYFIVLNGILKEVHDLNLAFQKRNGDITKLYSELRVLLLSLSRRILKPAYLTPIESCPTSLTMLHQADLDAVHRALNKANDEFGNSLLPSDSMDMGRKFNNFSSEHKVSPNNVKAVKQRVAEFIIRLCQELIQRLPNNLRVVENIKYFSPSVCLSQTHIPSENSPWVLAGDNLDEEAIDSEWRCLQTLKLCEISPDFSETPDVIDFWSAVWNIKNVNGQRTFENLAAFALRALSLPVSNAEVERIFSIMASIKTKTRNRMLEPMLVSMIRIRNHMKVHSICCKNYDPPEEMLNLCNKTIYDTNPTEKKIFQDEDDLLEAFEVFEQSVRAAGDEDGNN